LDVTYQLLFYADNGNVLGGKIRVLKKNTDALIVTSKEFGLRVNADKTKCMVLPRDQNAGRIRIVKTDNSLKGWKSSDIWEQP